MLELTHRRSGRCEKGRDGREILSGDQGRFDVPVDPVIAMHGVDRQQAHDEPAGEPDDRLRPDQERKPAVNLACPDMEAEPRAQNQVLTPATKLKPPVLSPRARVKRAVSPNCRSHDTPM